MHGLHGPSDDLPRSARVTSFSLNVVVIKRLSRVRITPRPTTIVAGSDPKLRAELIDQTGVVVKGAPVDFFVLYDWPDYKPWGEWRYGNETASELAKLGHRRFIAGFGKFADTLDVEVVPRAR